MKTKRIVITGGPGSGKTALIDYFEKEGYSCLPEISRQVTLQAQREGIDQLFLEKPILFSELLLKGRLQQFNDAARYTEKFLFYDRGMPDVSAYMDYIKMEYPSIFRNTCMQYRYDTIFLLPPWKDIYIQDNERYETYDQAEKIFEHLNKAYENYDYKVHHVPAGTLKYRSEYILQKLNAFF